METQLVHSNAVVVAHQFNPSIFSQLWLVRNGIAVEADFDDGESMFTPALVQVRCPGYVLLVLPEQLQFAPLVGQEERGEFVGDKIGRIVQRLPETPYSAVGLNFHWTVATDADEFAQFSRTLFFRRNPLFDHFQEDNARYGGYLSKNIFGARLKLEVKPTRTGNRDEAVERMLFAFNFHRDVGRDNAVADIQEMLRQWNDASEYSATIIRALETWQWR
jgi:hypothetical protein